MPNRIKNGVKYGLRKRVSSITSANQWAGTPEQEKFLVLYLDPKSQSFGNAYVSAMEAGFSESYARVVASPSVNRLWVQEARDLVKLGPEHVVQALQELALDTDNRPSDRIRALELVGKASGMFAERHVNLNVNIEQALKELDDA